MSTPLRSRTPKAPSDQLSHPTRQLLDELDALMQRMLDLPVTDVGEEPKMVPDAHGKLPAQEAVEVEDFSATELSEQPLPYAEHGADSERSLRRDGPGPLPEPESEIARAPSLWLTATAEEGDSSFADRHDKNEEEADEQPVAASSSETRDMSFHVAEFESQTEYSPPKTEERWDASLPVGPELLEAIAQSTRAEDEARRHTEESTSAQGPALVLPPPPALPLWARPLVRLNEIFDSYTTVLGPVGRWLRSPNGRALLGWAGLGLLAGASGWLILTEMGWSW